MRTPGTATQLEGQRQQIAVLLGEGSLSNQEIADAIGVHLSKVKHCKAALQRGGLAALAAKPHLGPKPKLTDQQRQQLLELVQRGALAAGFPTELWTCPRLATVVLQEFGVSYHPDHLGRILHDLGCTLQLPRQVDSRRDPEAIEEWRKQDWPRIKKKTQRQQASIVFLDEAAYLSEPLRRRSWGLRGQQPVLKAKTRSFKLSVLNALCVSPRQHLSQYFKIQQPAFDTADFVSVICELRRVLRRPIIVVWDNLRAHKAAEKQILLLKKRGIQFEPLPPYAPELNPVEPSWSQSKYGDLPNFTPENIDELEQAICQSLRKQRSNQKLLRSFFQGAKLPSAQTTQPQRRLSKK